jgi:hypothetical protein
MAWNQTHNEDKKESSLAYGRKRGISSSTSHFIGSCTRSITFNDAL